MQLIFVLVLLFSLFVAIVAVQNTTPVTVQFLAFQWADVPVAVLVLVSAAAGAILTVLLGFRGWWRNTRAVRQRDREIARLKAELARLQPAAVPAEPVAVDDESGGER